MGKKEKNEIPFNIENINAYMKFLFLFTLFYFVLMLPFFVVGCGSRDFHDIADNRASSTLVISHLSSTQHTIITMPTSDKKTYMSKGHVLDQ